MKEGEVKKIKLQREIKNVQNNINLVREELIVAHNQNEYNMLVNELQAYCKEKYNYIHELNKYYIERLTKLYEDVKQYSLLKKRVQELYFLMWNETGYNIIFDKKQIKKFILKIENSPMKKIRYYNSKELNNVCKMIADQLVDTYDSESSMINDIRKKQADFSGDNESLKTYFIQQLSHSEKYFKNEIELFEKNSMSCKNLELSTIYQHYKTCVLHTINQLSIYCK